MNSLTRVLLYSLFTLTLSALITLYPKYTKAQLLNTETSFHKSFYLATHTNPYAFHQWVFKIATIDTSELNDIVIPLTKKFNLSYCSIQLPNAATEFLVSTRKQFTVESLNQFINQLQSYLSKKQLHLVDFGIITTGQELLLAKTIQSPFYGASIINISGQIVDRYGSGIAYSSIGLPNKLLATISNEYGKFTLAIPAQFISDTLMVVALGYDTARIVLDPDITTNFVIRLKDNSQLFEGIEPSDSIKKKKLISLESKKSTTRLLTRAKQPGAQIAKLFHIKQLVQLKEVSIYVYCNQLEPAKLRLHLYTYNEFTGLPIKELLTENIIAEIEGNTGWVSFNIESNLLYTNQSLVAAIEWLDESYDNVYIGVSRPTSTACFELPGVFDLWVPSINYNWAIKLKVYPVTAYKKSI